MLARIGPVRSLRAGLDVGAGLISAVATRARGRLYRKYAALLVTLIASALLVSSGVESWYSYLENRAAIVDVQREKARGAAAVIEQFVREIEGQLGWTTHAAQPAGEGGLEQRRFDFLRLLRQAPAITEVAFVDSEGREQLTVSRLAMDVVGSKADRSQETAYQAAKANRRYVSPVYFRKESEPYLTLAITGASKRAGVSVAEVNLKFIWDVISRIKAGRAGIAYAVDDRGLLIAHPDIGLVLRKTDLSQLTQVKSALSARSGPATELPTVIDDASLAIAKDRLGRDVLTAYATVDPLGWYVFVEQPLAEAFEPVRASLWRTAGLALVGLALAALAGLWLAQRMVVPIEALAAGAARIGTGDLGHRIEVNSGDEVETLAASFNEMGARLKESYAGLEQRVEERTRELQEALNQQTATAQILEVIAGSPSDVAPVFESIIKTAETLCRADFGFIFQQAADGTYRLVSAPHATPEYIRYRTEVPVVPGKESALGRAVLECKTIHVPDTASDPSLPENHGHRIGRVRTALAVPLVSGERCIGIVGLGRFEPHAFSASHIALVETFADQAVIAIENARLFDAEQTRTKELQESLEYQTATSHVLDAISRSPTDIHRVFDKIAESAARLCRARFCNVYQFDGQYLSLVSAFGLTEPELADLAKYYPAPASRATGAARSILTGRIEEIPDIKVDADFALGDLSKKLGYRSIVAVPMFKDGRAIGSISVVRSEVGRLSRQQIELLKTFADQAVIAIENARLFEAEQARTQELTESLEYQTATAAVLNVISQSPTDVAPVFDVIARNAAELCGAAFSNIQIYDGSTVDVVATHNFTPEADVKFRRLFPMALDPRLTGSRAVLSRKVVHLPDVALDPEYPKDLSVSGNWRAILSVPMLREGLPLGVITVAQARALPFSDRQIHLLQTFADQAVIAINNVRLFEEVQKRTEELTRSVAELEALGKVGQAVSSSLDLKTVLGTILANACEISGTGGGAIYVLDEAKRLLSLEAGHNMSEALIQAVREHPLGLDDPMIGHSAVEGLPVQIADITEHRDHPLFEVLHAGGIRALLSVPLIHQGRTIGVLVMRRVRAGAFEPQAVSLLEAFASQSSIAINNARLFREIEEKGEQLRVASLHKSQFLANMSHELRTPLNAILGYTELIQDGVYGDLAPKVTGVLDRVQSNGRHLLGLINDVLDLSKIEAGQLTLDLDDYALGDVIHTVISATEALAAAKKLTLSADVTQGCPMAVATSGVSRRCC